MYGTLNDETLLHLKRVTDKKKGWGLLSNNSWIILLFVSLLQVVMLNEAYTRVEYRLDREGFDSVPALIRYYVGNRKAVSQVGFMPFDTADICQLVCFLI